jgi:hypothetical protein
MLLSQYPRYLFSTDCVLVLLKYYISYICSLELVSSVIMTSGQSLLCLISFTLLCYRQTLSSLVV